MDEPQTTRKISELQKMVGQLVEKERQRTLKEQIERRREATINLVSASYDKAAAYSNLVLAVGYAGFFTVWSNMNEFMSPVQSLVAAASVSVSLTLFVVWEIGQMLSNTRSMHLLRGALDAENKDFEARIDAAQLNADKAHVRVMRFYYPVFVATVLTGLVGPFVLLQVFFGQLLDRL